MHFTVDGKKECHRVGDDTFPRANATIHSINVEERACIGEGYQLIDRSHVVH